MLGVDTPETHRARCDVERVAGLAAKSFTADVLRNHVPADVGVRLCRWDKYGGRVLGDVLFFGKGNTVTSLSELLLAARHAAPYGGTGARRDWCGGGGGGLLLRPTDDVDVDVAATGA